MPKLGSRKTKKHAAFALCSTTTSVSQGGDKGASAHLFQPCHFPCAAAASKAIPFAAATPNNCQLANQLGCMLCAAWSSLFLWNFLLLSGTLLAIAFGFGAGCFLLTLAAGFSKGFDLLFRPLSLFCSKWKASASKSCKLFFARCLFWLRLFHLFLQALLQNCPGLVQGQPNEVAVCYLNWATPGWKCHHFVSKRYLDPCGWPSSSQYAPCPCEWPSSSLGCRSVSHFVFF